MPDGFKKRLNVFLIKHILFEILEIENHYNFNDKQASSKLDAFVNISDVMKVDMDETLFDTKENVINKILSTHNLQSSFSNSLKNNWSNSIYHESIVYDSKNILYQMEDECEDFLDEQKELPLEMMFTKNKSFLEDKIVEKEIKSKCLVVIKIK